MKGSWPASLVVSAKCSHGQQARLQQTEGKVEQQAGRCRSGSGRPQPSSAGLPGLGLASWGRLRELGGQRECGGGPTAQSFHSYTPKMKHFYNRFLKI